MNQELICVEICAGYAFAGIGLKKAGFTPAYACDNDGWDGKKFTLDAVANYNANFSRPDGSPVCFRRDICELTGAEILDEVYRAYGTRTVHLMFGGPPCQNWSKLNTSKGKNPPKVKPPKNSLINEYLRMVSEVTPLVAVMEQVPDFLNPTNDEDKKILNQFFSTLKRIGYKVAYCILNAKDYGVPQSRERVIVMLVRDDLNKEPVFPDQLPLHQLVMITDVLNIDGFSSGHFGEGMKDVVLHPFICTVTSTSPDWLYKGGKRWHPTTDELLICQSVDPKSYKHVGSKSKFKKGIANGVPSELAYHIAKCIREQIFMMPGIDS